MIAIGCDPGTTGYIAAVHRSRGLIAYNKLPLKDKAPGRKSNRVDSVALNLLLRDITRLCKGDPRFGVIEQVQSFGGEDQMGNFTAFGMGHAAGVAEGAIAAHTGRIVEVPPSRWRKHYGISVPKGMDKKQRVSELKRQSVEMALSIYGDQLPSRLSHNAAEAILITHYGLTQA